MFGRQLKANEKRRIKSGKKSPVSDSGCETSPTGSIDPDSKYTIFDCVQKMGKPEIFKSHIINNENPYVKIVEKKVEITL